MLLSMDTGNSVKTMMESHLPLGATKLSLEAFGHRFYYTPSTTTFSQTTSCHDIYVSQSPFDLHSKSVISNVREELRIVHQSIVLTAVALKVRLVN
jgi:hypothetical protein